MKVITGSRRSGRTTEIIRTAVARDAIIVCASHDLCRHVQLFARDMGHEVQTMTFSQYINSLGREYESVVIDNLELCLERMTNSHIEAISCLSGETLTLHRDPEYLLMR